MEEYKPNSYKSKEEPKPTEKKVEKVISGQAHQRKRGSMTKFADVFVAEDMDSVKSYIFMDVLVPAIKKAISDIVTNGIDMLLYGENGSTKSKSTASKVSYRSYYDQRNNDREQYARAYPRRGYDFDDVVVETRGEAEEVLTRLDEALATYKTVSIADLYDLVGITAQYTDNKYGWTDIHSAQVVRIRDGYLIKMPRPMPLD